MKAAEAGVSSFRRMCATRSVRKKIHARPKTADESAHVYDAENLQKFMRTQPMMLLGSTVMHMQTEYIFPLIMAGGPGIFRGKGPVNFRDSFGGV